MMSTANLVTHETKRLPDQAELPQAAVDQQAEDERLTRWLPDWMVARLARWNLPAPLALAVIAAALLGALISPFLAANGLMGLLAAGAILGIAGIVVVVKWRILGFLALPFAALMVPFAIGTGSDTGINAAVLVLGLLIGLWLLDMLTRTRQIRLWSYRPVIASLVLGVVAVVAFGFGQLPWFPVASAPITAQIGGLLIFLLSISAFLLAAHQIKTVKELEWLCWVFLAIGFVFFAFRLFPSLYNIMSRIFVRQGVLGATLYIWLVAIALSQAILNKKLAMGWRLVLGLLVLMIFYVNMIGESRFWVSGWLPPMVTLVTIIVLARPDLGFFAVIGGVLVLLLNTSIVSGITNEGDNTYSTLTRLEAWRIMAEIIKVNPIFGLGMANYYFYTPLFPILGYAISFNSHNNYIDLLAQTGLVGLAVFLWLLAEIWILGWKIRCLVPEGFPRAYVIGALGGLVGTAAAALLGDWVIPFVYNIGLEGLRASMFIWIFLGGLLAIAHIYLPGGKGDEARSG